MSLDDAWELAVAISPRATLRVQPRDAYGHFTGTYNSAASIDGPTPDGLWALHLTDTEHRFHFIALDLDGKTPEAARQALHDRDRIVGWLNTAGIEHLVCASGGRGEGWHIWIALYDAVEPDTVWALRDQLKAACPSLDTAPLGNLATGCVRPPYSPHASGGTSRVVAGDINILTRATTTTADLHRLTALLAEEVTALPARVALDHDILRTLPHDADGHPHMPGAVRSLAPRAKQLLSQPPTGDTSSVCFTILLSMARARYTYRDVVNHRDAPGLEHLRTMPDPRTDHRRIPRPTRGPHSQDQLLQRQWRRAVAVVATTKDSQGSDDTFLPRADAIATIIEELQTRADAATNRWRGSPGAADRRVLDALHLIALEAVTPDVDASIRLLANHTGLGREVVRTALWRLQDHGWITRTSEAAGTQAATWSIDPQRVLHTTLDRIRSQAVPPRTPPPSTTATRDRLREELRTRQHRARHDAFTPAGLGTEAGNRYARGIPPQPAHSPTDERLADHGVTPHTTRDRLDAIARHFGCDGTLRRRREQYQVEQTMWRWWIGEVDRMRSQRRNQPALGQPNTWVRWGRFPRRSDGRASFRAARLELRERMLT